MEIRMNTKEADRLEWIRATDQGRLSREEGGAVAKDIEAASRAEFLAGTTKKGRRDWPIGHEGCGPIAAFRRRCVKMG